MEPKQAQEILQYLKEITNLLRNIEYYIKRLEK